MSVGLKVAIASERWSAPGSGQYSNASHILGAARSVGVDAVPLPLTSTSPRARVGGLAVPLLRQWILRYSTDADVVHETDCTARRGVDVVTIHDFYPFHDNLLPHRFRRVALRMSARRAKIVIVSQRAAELEFLSIMPSYRSKTRTIPLPAAPTSPHRLEPLYDALWVGTVGPQKRIMDFLRCVERNPDLKFAVRCDVSGRETDPQIPRLLRQCPNLTELPWLTEEMLDRVYRQSRAILSTSDYEGWHLPITEAYLRGCRVVLPTIEPYLSIFAEAMNDPFWYRPEAAGNPIDRALHSALSDARPATPDPKVVALVSYAHVGNALKSVYEEVQRR